MEKIEEVIKRAISIERYGQQFYNQLSNVIIDEEGKSIIKGLANDEKKHEEELSIEFERMVGAAVPSEIEQDRFDSETMNKIFKGDDEKLEKADIYAALEVGIATEQRSIDFYTSNKDITSDEKLAKLFAHLVEIEKGHKSLLEENLFHLKQDGSWWGYVPILEG